MNSVGHVGQPRVVSAPKAATVSEALNLLSVFGGGDQRVRDMLVELQAATESNERLLAQFEGLALREADVSRREREVREAETRVDGKLAVVARIRAEISDGGKA